MDFNKLIARVKGILLTPKTEWPVIAGEPATVADLYKGYIIWLAAIPPLAAFLVTVRFSASSRADAARSSTYALSLAMVFVVALIVEALAPSFGGTKDRVQALKTIAYCYTASWVAGIAVDRALHQSAHHARGRHLRHLSAVPRAAAHDEVSAGQGRRLHGGDHHRRDPAEPPHRRGRRGGHRRRRLHARRIAVQCLARLTRHDVRQGQHGRQARAVRASRSKTPSKKMEAAQKSGDQQAQAEAMKSMMGAALGGGDVEALAPDRLKPFLPESLGGMNRARRSRRQRNSAMGMQMTEAKATLHERRRSLVGSADHRHRHREGPARARRLGRHRRRERNVDRLRQDVPRRRTADPRAVGSQQLAAASTGSCSANASPSRSKVRPTASTI